MRMTSVHERLAPATPERSTTSSPASAPTATCSGRPSARRRSGSASTTRSASAPTATTGRWLRGLAYVPGEGSRSPRPPARRSPHPRVPDPPRRPGDYARHSLDVHVRLADPAVAGVPRHVVEDVLDCAGARRRAGCRRPPDPALARARQGADHALARRGEGDLGARGRRGRPHGPRRARRAARGLDERLAVARALARRPTPRPSSARASRSRRTRPPRPWPGSCSRARGSSAARGSRPSRRAPLLILGLASVFALHSVVLPAERPRGSPRDDLRADGS